MPRKPQRRDETLSRERIIEAAVALLDESGESGLTFRALSERLATGPGAIYWHIASKGTLLSAACDAVVSRTLDTLGLAKSPKDAMRALALGIFDAIDAHPWVGAALPLAPGQLPMVRILERIGQLVIDFGVAEDRQWALASALLHYILGVSGQNAANARIAQEQGWDRSQVLNDVSTMWSQLDPDRYPFTCRQANAIREHDDRQDFLAGIDLFVAGMGHEHCG